MKLTRRTHIAAFTCLGFILLAGGCETTPPAPESVEFHDEETIEARIVAIDVDKRLATLESDLVVTTRARLLAFVATASGLTQTGTNATTYTLGVLFTAGNRL